MSQIWSIGVPRALEPLISWSIGASVSALPVIFPVHFALFEESVLFRTAPGTKLDAATIGAVVAFQADAREPFGESHWSVNRVVSVAHPPTKLPSSRPATRGRPAGPLVGGQKVGVAQAPGEGLEQLAHHRGDFSHQLEQVGSVQLQHLEIAGRCHRGRAWLAVDQG